MLRNPIPLNAARVFFLATCLSVTLLFFPRPAHALDPSIANTQYAMSSWMADDGLPQNGINAIAQTPDGYLWFATEEGVARFDGVRFKTFLERRYVSALLVSRDGSLWIASGRGLTRYKNFKMTFYPMKGVRTGMINSMSEGLDGSIWMASNLGLCRFAQGKFSIYIAGNPGFAPDWVWSTTVTRDGALWWGTNGSGLKRLYKGSVTTFTTRDGLADNIVFALREDRKGDLWIGTNHGLSKMHDAKITTIPKANGLTDQCVKVIREDRNGNLWIGTDGGGLNRYSAGKFTSFGTQHKLSGTTILALLEDQEGSLWVGTSGVGVVQLRPSKFITIGPLEGLSPDIVFSVRESIDGSLLIGTNHGFWRWKDGAATSLTLRDGLSAEIIRSVTEDHLGGIWLGTKEGANRYQHGAVTVYRTSNGLPNNTVRVVLEDRQRNLWIGTRGGGLAQYRDGVFKIFNRTNGFTGQLITSIREDRDGSLWIASDGDGVNVLKNGVFTNYLVRDGLSTNSAWATHQDHQGTHWIGTYGGGLNRLKNGRISRISVKDGLFDDIVFAIVEDRKGYLWMTCNRGISRVSIQELNDFADGKIKRVHPVSFGVADGMKAAECNGGSPGAWEGRDGRLFFATVRGVAIIDPNHIPFNVLPPPVWNEEVLLDGKTENVSAAGLTVSPGPHSLEIHYTALSLLMPKSVRFRYRLRGFSDEWVDAGDRRTAFYTNLPPGTFTFEVMGSNNDGVWGTAANPVQVHVEAAFFQTLLFKIACCAVLLLAVRAAFHVRLKLLQERERVLVNRVGEQTAALISAKTAAESVAETNTRLRLKNELILNSIADGVYVVDLSGIISLENPAASRMLGWESGSLLGRPAHETIHHSTLDLPYPIDDCPIHRTLHDGVLRQVRNEVFWRKDGTSFPVHYLAAPILDSKECVTGVAVTFRDVTELQAIEQLKSEFVSTVSHELRTPLTAIRGALGLLDSGLLGPIAEKGHRMLNIAVANTDRLVRLINSILDLERMAAGKTEMTRMPVDAEAILVQAAEALQSIAEEADVRIVIKPATGTVWGDSDRIMQTLTNLLANAIKFSPRQTTVTVSGTPLDNEFVFCIADEGRGVPKEKQETIFERFSQVDSSDSRDKGGSGLGLAICHSIVTAHGGRIWVENNDPVGTRFQFTIPLVNVEGQHAA